MALLDVDRVTVRFGGNVAVQEVSLEAEPGRINGLIGPNGAGKTTLFNVITGLQAPNRGHVALDGENITGLPPYKRARKGMARTFQRLELFGALTVRENIQVAASIRNQWGKTGEQPAAAARRLMAMVGLERMADVRADALPTGQARLVELGRALATRPRLLLLDEPAAGQDESETEHFADLLRHLAQEDIAILLVEHDMQLVMNVCEHIHVLDFGRLMAAGHPGPDPQRSHRAEPRTSAASGSRHDRDPPRAARDPGGLRGHRGPPRRIVPGSPGQRVRRARPQRGGEDDHVAGHRRPARADQGRRPHRRPPGQRRPPRRPGPPGHVHDSRGPRDLPQSDRAGKPLDGHLPRE